MSSAIWGFSDVLTYIFFGKKAQNCIQTIKALSLKHTNRAINQCSDRTAKNIEGGPLSLCEVCTQLWLHRQDDKWNAIV